MWKKNSYLFLKARMKNVQFKRHVCRYGLVSSKQAGFKTFNVPRNLVMFPYEITKAKNTL